MRYERPESQSLLKLVRAPAPPPPKMREVVRVILEIPAEDLQHCKNTANTRSRRYPWKGFSKGFCERQRKPPERTNQMSENDDYLGVLFWWNPKTRRGVLAVELKKPTLLCNHSVWAASKAPVMPLRSLVRYPLNSWHFSARSTR